VCNIIGGLPFSGRLEGRVPLFAGDKAGEE